MKRMRVAAMITVIVAASAGTAIAATPVNQWVSAGRDLNNSRFQPAERKISPTSVGNLTVKWIVTTGADVSATPAVDGATVYVPDWSGHLYAVNRDTGEVRWSRLVSDYTGVPGDLARSTPAIDRNRLILGDQRGNGARVFAVNKETGAPLWSTLVDPHFAAIITQSAVVVGDTAYVGVSSLEESFAAFIPGYVCCTFRGSMVALDVRTGAIRWKTYMTPAGFSGNAVWGSTPVVDKSTNTLYLTTGNNYSVPQATLDCVAAAPNDEARRACNDPNNFLDSIVALDATTGQVKWIFQALPFDAWTVGCIPGFFDVNCPEPEGPDYDFGQGPALFTVTLPDGGRRQLLGAGQKSGQYWALDPATGAVVWVTQTGPGGTAGGLQWGSAVDGRRIYTANANSLGVNWTLAGSGTVTNAGIWSALDAATGQILWQTATPNGGGASGPTSVANGVVFGCALDPLGTMVAMNAATGAILWSFQSGGSCLSGAAVVDGSVYWGSGYSNFGFGTPNNKLYAFTLP